MVKATWLLADFTTTFRLVKRGGRVWETLTVILDTESLYSGYCREALSQISVSSQSEMGYTKFQLGKYLRFPRKVHTQGWNGVYVSV